MATLARVEHDHYALLGVDDDADSKALRAAYLARMRLHHPDRHPGDPGDRARDLNRAYEVLSDPARRAAYDRIRHARNSSTVRLSSAGSSASGPFVSRGTAARRHVAGNRASAPRGARTVVDAAYSEDNQRYYRSVSAGLVRIGAGVFAVGLVLLVLLSV